MLEFQVNLREGVFQVLLSDTTLGANAKPMVMGIQRELLDL